MTTDRILLALQPESTAEALLGQAILWAQRFGTPLDICTVLPASVLHADPLHISAGVLDDAEKAVSAQRHIVAWLEDCLDDVPAEVRGDAHVLSGSPETSVREHAGNYRMLLLGTHHRKDLTRLLLGSVSEALVRTSPVPVLVLPTAPRAAQEPLRIHLPIDPADPNFHAVEWAESNLPDAELTAVYLLPWMKTFGPMQPNGQVVLNEARERLRVALMDGGHSEVNGVVVVREETSVGDALAHEAETGLVDLIAMPTHGRTGIAHLLFGSVSERVVRSADCAVLVVR